MVAAHLGQRVEAEPDRVPERRRQTRSFSSLMYWKAWVTSARSTPGERPGGCWGLRGSLTYTSAPLASSILPTQLVAVRGIP